MEISSKATYDLASRPALDGCPAVPVAGAAAAAAVVTGDRPDLSVSVKDCGVIDTPALYTITHDIPVVNNLYN